MYNAIYNQYATASNLAFGTSILSFGTAGVLAMKHAGAYALAGGCKAAETALTYFKNNQTKENKAWIQSLQSQQKQWLRIAAKDLKHDAMIIVGLTALGITSFSLSYYLQEQQIVETTNPDQSGITKEQENYHEPEVLGEQVNQKPEVLHEQVIQTDTVFEKKVGQGENMSEVSDSSWNASQLGNQVETSTKPESFKEYYRKKRREFDMQYVFNTYKPSEYKPGEAFFVYTRLPVPVEKFIRTMWLFARHPLQYAELLRKTTGFITKGTYIPPSV
jgi:hypothetical protein